MTKGIEDLTFIYLMDTFKYPEVKKVIYPFLKWKYLSDNLETRKREIFLRKMEEQQRSKKITPSSV